MKSYVSLFEVEALRVLVNAEVASASVTDDALKCLKASDSELGDTELVEFSRHLHRLLTRITSGSAQLVVRRNVELNGFETWRLLTEEFSLPGTAPDISLLNSLLEFKFGTEQFEQDLSEWETLKTKYETQAGTALPDSILVATLLSRTTGTLRQHLKMNVRSLDTYDTARNVITEYHQSRHVTGFESLSDTDHAPTGMGSMWQGKGRVKYPFGPLTRESKSRERNEGFHWKGKGRGKYPFCPLIGKGKSKGGKSVHTEERKASRSRCWNCGRHGHLEKDCRNVVALTDKNKEACDDWKYCRKDWTNWTKSRTDDWSCSSDYNWTQSDWHGDSNWYDSGWNDSWTWSTGSDSTGNSVLSHPQRPIALNSTAEISECFTSVQSDQTAPAPSVSAPCSTVSVTDLETGRTTTHTPSRRTGSLTRPLRTGTGLLSTLVSVIAVLNSFGKPQGLPLIPETVSSPEVTFSDKYDDVFGRHHENCFSSLSPKEHWILFDSGAAAHCCPLDYAPDYPLLPVGKNPPDLKSVTGMPLNIIGRKLIRYDTPETVLYINYYVCDVPFCIVSVARLLLQDFCTILTKDSMKLLTPQRASVDITRHGTLLYLTPDVAPYHPDMKKVEKELDQHMSTLDIDMTKVPELPTGVDAVEQLKLLINTLKSTQYHTDLWQLDEVNHTLTRVHTCPRRTFFTPESSDCPVPLDRLNGQRTTHLDYGKGDVKEVLDNFRNTGLPNQVIDGDWKGRTVFQLKTVPTHRYHSKTALDSNAVPKEEPEHTEVQSPTVRNPVRNSQGSPDFNTDHERMVNQKLMTFRDFDDTDFHKVLLELFEMPDTETGEFRTSDRWIYTPAAWIRFHHVPRRTLYVPEEIDAPHDCLGSHRLTLFYKTSTDQDGESCEDQWNVDNNRDVGFIWTGLTLFQTSNCISDTVKQGIRDKAAKDTKALHRSKDPTEQQRAVHNLTHLPYRSWCEHCTKAKSQSTRQIDKQPVIQIDFFFIHTGPDVGKRLVLTAVDIQTGLATAVLVPHKGRHKYSVAELKKFIYETGRTYGILQYEKRPALKALATDVAKELKGMSIRATPKNWKQTRESIGKMHQTLVEQSRTLRLQLQKRLCTEADLNQCIFPWVVKHSQFLLNRFHTHEDGCTSYFKRWKRDYQEPLCEFGETVLFRMSGKSRDEDDTAWHTGIWLGKDTEADESIVHCEGTVHKVRTVKRVVSSKRWNAALHRLLNSTPWNPKGKGDADTSFVLPPAMIASGRVRPPPGLDTEVFEEHTKEMKSKEQTASELQRQPIGVSSVATVDGNVSVSRNEDTEELTEELKLVEPHLDYVEGKFTKQEVIDGIETEIRSMKQLDVYDEIPIENCSQDDINNALDCTWIKQRKTATKVKCRLCVRNCVQETIDHDDVSVSTTALVTLRVLLLMTLSRCWTATVCNFSTAFLHDPMTERILMRPPSEYSPNGNCLWLLKRAMYGLKQLPALWQIHFTKVMTELGFHRCKVDSNLYCHDSTELYVLRHVDDLLVCGTPERTKEFIDQLSQEVLLKTESKLKPQTSIDFLGQTLKHNGDSISVSMPTAYVTDLLTLCGMENSKPSPTIGTSIGPKVQPEPLDRNERKKYCAIIGKLLRLALIRPDIAYATKELTRDLTAPTTESITKVKCLLRYIAGTKDHCQRLCPNVTLESSNCTLDLDCYVDSDWAGCRRTRKSTSGTVVQILNSTVSFGSRTQGTIALSPDEAELYAIGQGTSEALYIRNLITEAKLAKSVNINIHTDSTVGKSMATRIGASKKTMHVELRFRYVQELVGKRLIKLRKVRTDCNCANVLTRYLGTELLRSHLRRLCVSSPTEWFEL